MRVQNAFHAYRLCKWRRSDVGLPVVGRALVPRMNSPPPGEPKMRPLHPFRWLQRAIVDQACSESPFAMGWRLLFRPDLWRQASRSLNPLNLQAFTALALLSISPAAAQDRQPTSAGIFAGYLQSSGGATREGWFAGAFFDAPGLLERVRIRGSFAFGEAKASEDGALPIDITAARVGARVLLPHGVFAGASYWRATGDVEVAQLGGLRVIEVDYGPGVEAGYVSPWVLFGGPVTVSTKYDWAQPAPRPETGGLCLEAGMVELCASRSTIHLMDPVTAADQKIEVESLRLTLRYQFGSLSRR